MKKPNLLSLLFLTALCLSTINNLYAQNKKTKNTISILGENISSDILCAECKPGNDGEIMVLYENTYSPDLTENSDPIEMAYELLGRVYFSSDLRGNLPTFCSNSTSLDNPFTKKSIKSSSNTGKKGTKIKYEWKKKVDLNAELQVKLDLEEIMKNQPNLEKSKLDSFAVELTAAYRKFADKEVTVSGKYFEYTIHHDSLIALARSIGNYKECNELIYDRDLKLINAIGMVYFDINQEKNSLDEIAADLQSKAMAQGITYAIKFNFKQTISESIEKFTEGYYQVIVLSFITEAELDRLALKINFK